MARSRLGPNSRVVMTRTPLRVSFAGGGTDLSAFYTREYGAVVSTTIDRYVYVTVKRHSELFFEPIRLNYSTSEQVNRIDEIENRIARECLELLDVEPPIYISTVGDVPASTGLGGSSSFAVGLLHALHAYRGERVGAAQLAEEACRIEIDILGEPIGKQDQYAAAIGGMNLLRFQPDGSVTAQSQRLPNGGAHALFDAVLMFWTGHQRDASGVLSEQRSNMSRPDTFEALRRMRQQAERLHAVLDNGGVDLHEIGEILDENWRLKRTLAGSISNGRIDMWYDRARAAGALGGKLCGAGGGGFLLFIVPPEGKDRVREALADLTEMAVDHESHGSEVVFHD